MKWEDRESTVVLSVGLVGGGKHVDRYMQKERTFLTREIALEDIGVVLSLPGFGRQDVNINKQTI